MTKSPLPTPLVFTQNKKATHPRIGLGLGSQLIPSKTASPLVFFQLHWLEHGHQRKLSGHLLAKSHRYIKYKNWSISLVIIQRMVLHLHHAFCLVSGINSKFVFKITLPWSSILQCYLPVLLIKANFWFRFACWCSGLWGLQCVLHHIVQFATHRHFSGKLNVFHHYQAITFTYYQALGFRGKNCFQYQVVIVNYNGTENTKSFPVTLTD